MIDKLRIVDKNGKELYLYFIEDIDKMSIVEKFDKNVINVTKKTNDVLIEIK
ncbi:MAG: hypothetical protein HN952_06245 [Candidatus Cloacimonetes bacterium]|nr:hypothetical protein [Candidatus Cloacimonadota bacterium]